MKNQLDFPDEVQYLEYVNERLRKAAAEADRSIGRKDKDYKEAKQYMVQHHGEIDPHEMFQNELLLQQIDRGGVIAVEARGKLAKLMDSPYFARIDFKMEDEEPEPYYIGRFAFSDEEDFLVLDWRSPIASMFYDYEVGSAGYDAPMGRIEGEVVRKRQFKIQKGILEYVLESAVNIQDDVLQRELSRTSDEKMRSIIATIQQEQNAIIRNEKAKTLIIQGVAGSGKTSIALHRIAFLLYRYKDSLSAKNIVVLSPNQAFGDYISNVLPELGEEPMGSISFAEIAEKQLGKEIKFHPGHDPLELTDPDRGKRIQLKSTLEFVQKMNRYLKEKAEQIFSPSNYEFGRFRVTGEWIARRFAGYESYPIKKRLQMIAGEIHDQFDSENYMEEPLPRPKEIEGVLTGMLAFKTTMALYRDFYKTMNMPDGFVLAEKNTLEWEDVFPYLYFKSAFEGLKEGTEIKHLIIDEMQDYTPIQYTVINLLFKSRKTILGDFGQSVNGLHTHTLDDLHQIYQEAEVVKLHRSYRSTCEIISFANRIKKSEKMDVVARHGDEPDLVSCKGEEEEINHIKESIRGFFGSGRTNLGIILKDAGQAKSLYTKLKETLPVNLLTADSKTFQKGVTVTCITISKGLEFDEIIIPSSNEETYNSERDRNLLYIACTRAMHKLTLTYCGRLTPLITHG